VALIDTEPSFYELFSPPPLLLCGIVLSREKLADWSVPRTKTLYLLGFFLAQQMTVHEAVARPKK
jgi:hypothetical protein